MIMPQRVRFHPYAQVQPVASLKEAQHMDVDNDMDLWMSHQDFLLQFQRDANLLTWIQDGLISCKDEEDAPDLTYSVRGLESRTEAGLLSKQRHRENAYSAVLDEQEEQFENKVPADPQAIRSVYRAYSRKDQCRAHQMALQDAAWVERNVRQGSGKRIESSMRWKSLILETPVERHSVVPTAA